MVVSSLLLRRHRRRAGVEQGKAAGAVGRLHHARREAGLADGGGLLVAGDARDRDAAAEQFRARCRRNRRRNPSPRAAASAAPAGFSAARRPTAPVWMLNSSVREALVASVACDLAAGQPPQQIAIDGAEQQFAALGAFARAGDVVEDPGDFGAGEIGIEIRPVLRRDRGLVAFGLQSRRRCRRCGGPARRWRGGSPCRCARSHTTVVSRWLVMPIAAMSLAVDAGLRQRLAADGDASRSRCPRARARPSRRPENAAGIPAARSRRSRCRRETRWRARRWCPDRWPARRT